MVDLHNLLGLRCQLSIQLQVFESLIGDVSQRLFSEMKLITLVALKQMKNFISFFPSNTVDDRLCAGEIQSSN